jgi:hypothetical protein
VAAVTGSIALTLSVGGALPTGAWLPSPIVPGTYTIYHRVASAPSAQTVELNASASAQTIEIDSVTVEGPVGHSLGSEIVPDPGFDNSSAWTVGANVNVSGSQVNFTGSALSATARVTTPNETIVALDWYFVSFDQVAQTANNLAARVGGSSVPANAVGTFSGFVRAGVTLNVDISGSGFFGSLTASADNFSVKRVVFEY